MSSLKTDNEKQQGAVANLDPEVAPWRWRFITPCLGASVANDIWSFELQ